MFKLVSGALITLAGFAYGIKTTMTIVGGGLTSVPFITLDMINPNFVVPLPAVISLVMAAIGGIMMYSERRRTPR